MTEPPNSQVKRGATGSGGAATAARAGVSQLWLVLPIFILTLAAGAALARWFPAFRWQSLPILAAAIGTLAFAYAVNRLVIRASQEEPAQEAIGESLRGLLESAGPSVIALDLHGELNYCNPAAERLLGYRADELKQLWGNADVLAPGECERLVAEIRKLCHVNPTPERARAGNLNAYLACVRMLPAGMVPGFSTQVRRKDGTIVPVTLHVSALRDPMAEFTGMVAVAAEQGATPQREHSQRESQERYRDLFESSGEMIATLSPAGQFLYANQSWQRCFGLDRTAVLALPSFEDLFSPDARAEVAALFRCALNGEPVERARLRHHSSDGRVLDLELSLSRRQNAGKPLEIRCLLSNVKPQEQRENQPTLQPAVSRIAEENAPGEPTDARIPLEEHEAVAAGEIAATSPAQKLAGTQEHGHADDLRRQQEILLDAVTDGICGLDRDGNVRFANPAAGRLLGAPPEALVGKPLHELLHGAAAPERVCSQQCPLRKAAERPASASGEENLFRADGASFPAEYVLTPIHVNGSLSGWVLSFRDISQRFALDRMKDEFIATVSHELRTPLTSIRGALGLLTSGMLGEVNEKASNLLRIALTNSDRLVRLINDILDLERIQSGREPLAFRTVQLADIVKQAIDDMQPMADAAGVKLLHDTTRVEVTADPDRLLQVMTNLLSNAVKFSPPNAQVSVMLRPGVTGVIFSVIDHGRGIPVEKLETIFGRFQQVDASDSRQKGGTGLGLAICRTIVLQHSGRIWAERNPVRGSTFRIFLPYHPASVAEPDGKPESQARYGSVVLADPDAETRGETAALLASHGYSVVQTTTVEQTIAASRQGAHAILVDTSLDGMNGWVILPLLRSPDAAGRTPVVLLSVERPEALASGADGLVTKPVEDDTLFAELARVLCGPGDRARILIVEDDREMARMIGDVFAQRGIAVQTAHSLEETIDRCADFEPHLLVLDIGLPDGDGFNVVDWLRQHENLAHLPVVVYTGRELSPGERRHLTLGPTYFLGKTRVQPQQLEAVVLTMLRSQRQTREEASAQPVAPNS
jgi:PAS domain S-box-containing protein